MRIVIYKRSFLTLLVSVLFVPLWFFESKIYHRGTGNTELERRGKISYLFYSVLGFRNRLLLTVALLFLLVCGNSFALRGTLLAEVQTQIDGTISKQYLLKVSRRSLVRLRMTSDFEKILEEFTGGEVDIKLGTDGSVLAVRLLSKALSRAPLAQVARTGSDDPAPENADVRHRVAFVLVEFPGVPSSADINKLYELARQNGAFNSGGVWHGAPWSINDIYLLSSQGKFGFDFSMPRKPTRTAGRPAFFGPVLVQRGVNETCESDYHAWSDRALDEAANLGLVAARFDHIVFIFPSFGDINCSVVGRAELLGKLVWIYRPTVSTIAHELGHNLGLHHAGLAQPEAVHAEYADLSCPMGGLNPVPVLFNAPHRIQLGWTDRLPGGFKDILEHGSYALEIGSLENQASPSGYQIVRIATGDGAPPYVLSYRMEGSISDPEYRTGISIHRDFGLGKPTALLGTLSNGATLYDSKAGLRITQVGRTQYSAKVQIDFDSSLRQEQRGEESCLFYDPCAEGLGGADVGSSAHFCSGANVQGQLNPLTLAMLPLQCPDTITDLSKDSNGNGIVDAWDYVLDADQDGTPNASDCARLDPNRWSNGVYRDTDGDGFADPGAQYQNVCAGKSVPPGYSTITVGHSLDNCPFIANPDQQDRDLDKIGDACDPSVGDDDFLKRNRYLIIQVERLVRQVAEDSSSRKTLRKLHTIRKIVDSVSVLALLSNGEAFPDPKQLKVASSQVSDMMKLKGRAFFSKRRRLRIMLARQLARVPQQ